MLLDLLITLEMRLHLNAVLSKKLFCYANIFHIFFYVREFTILKHVKT